MSFKKWVDYQRLYPSRFEWDIKQATLGKSYEELNKNKLLGGFISILIGTKSVAGLR
jgi:hypothetical protein